MAERRTAAQVRAELAAERIEVAAGVQALRAEALQAAKLAAVVIVAVGAVGAGLLLLRRLL
jgi:hypothetical protein